MIHNAGKSAPVSTRAQKASTMTRLLASTARVFDQRMSAVIGGAVLALAAATQANAASFGDDDPARQYVCSLIGCGDGARECGKATGTFDIWMFMPVPPYVYAVTYPFTVSCYEQPAM